MDWHFKEAVDELEKGRPSPLSGFEKEGGAVWRRGEDRGGFIPSSYDPSENPRTEYWILELQNKAFGKSGATKVTMAPGWTATWFLYSENNEFFSNNTVNAIRAEAQIKRELLYDESLEITLSGGDYFSLDVDEEHKGIFRFRLVKDGVQVNIEDPENPNNEIFIAMKNAYYTPTDPGPGGGGGGEGGGGGPGPGPNDCAPGFVFDPSTQTCVPEQNGGGGGDDEDDDGSPILGFLLLGLVAFGLWWLFSKPDSVKTDSSTFTKSPPDTGGLGDA